MYVRQKAVPEAKIKRVRELAELFEKYDSVLVVNITGVPAPVLHEMRKKLREEGHVLKVVKNTLAKIAIDEVAEKKRGIERLKDRLVGQNALIFTSENVFSLKMFLDKNKIAREARAGDVAQSDVVVPAGNTNLAPGPVLSLFSKLKIPTNIKEGSIWVAKDTVVAKKGDVISSDLAELLRKLDVKPIEVGLEVKAAYADGVVLAAEALEIDLEEIREELVRAAAQAANLAINIAFPTRETAAALVAKAHAEALNLAANAAFPTRETAAALVAKAHAQASALLSRIEGKF